MRVALVHDYLAQDGGAERVLLALHEIYPQAPIFVLFHDRKKITNFPTTQIKESFLSKLPLINSAYQWYLPLMPLATERHNLKNFDVVISSTSAFAKGVITDPDTLHISYCHTPPRYLWAGAHDYLNELKSNSLIKILLTPIIHRIRIWDNFSTLRVDHFIANSQTVQKRINKYYRRDSEVIYPPVNLKNFSISPKIDNYFVAGGRLVPYKRVDLVIKTFNRLRWPLKIFGTGPELNRLRKLAKPNVEFLGRINEPDKANLLNRAQAFIHPQLEDFGITPLESMACGRPVVAYSQGGATETVIPDETGVFFPNQNWESLLDALLNFPERTWDSARIRAQAANFSEEIFKAKIIKNVADKFEEFRKGMRQVELIK